MKQKLDIHRHYHWKLDWDTVAVVFVVMAIMVMIGLYLEMTLLLPRFDRAMASHDKALIEECARLRTRIHCLEMMMEERVKQIEVIPNGAMKDFEE